MAVIVLNQEVDRLGMDLNETGWVIAWVIECYEKGLFTKKDTDGLEMTWGNVEAVRSMIQKIAYRQGFGEVLAEGAMRAACHIGGEAADLAIYTKKGNTPRGHDHRIAWHMLLDVCTSSWGTDEASLLLVNPVKLGLPKETDIFTPEGAAKVLWAGGGRMPLEDCLVICKISVLGVRDEYLIEVLNAVTGWDFTYEEARRQLGQRVVNLFRAFNVRHGLTTDLERPSPKYGSAPADGPAKGKSILTVWDKALHSYYELMGWDIKTGKPLPDTLRKCGLEHIIQDIWDREC